MKKSRKKNNVARWPSRACHEIERLAKQGYADEHTSDKARRKYCRWCAKNGLPFPVREGSLHTFLRRVQQ